MTSGLMTIADRKRYEDTIKEVAELRQSMANLRKRVSDLEADAAKRRGGRPKGSKNRPKQEISGLDALSAG